MISNWLADCLTARYQQDLLELMKRPTNRWLEKSILAGMQRKTRRLRRG